VGIFQTDRNANQAIGDPEGLTHLCVYIGVRGCGRMRHQRFKPPRLSAREHSCR
jgi:hypothetical protein